MTDEYLHAAKALMSADALLITAGAGIGVDSGLPDFRGNEGFWRAYPPIAKLGIPFYEMANPRWFESDPHLAWAFYGHRLNLYRQTVPHHGFDRFLDFCKTNNKDYFVFTSNVDGQFQKAGFAEDKIEECHGSIHHLQCSRPCTNHIWSADDLLIAVDEDRFQAQEPLPVCPGCGSIARPNILMFGDWSWISDRTNHQNRNCSGWLKNLNIKGCSLVIIEIGAGQAVATVRHFSESVARQLKAMLIRINPRDYMVPSGNISISAGALEGIDKIFAAMSRSENKSSE